MESLLDSKLEFLMSCYCYPADVTFVNGAAATDDVLHASALLAYLNPES